MDMNMKGLFVDPGCLQKGGQIAAVIQAAAKSMDNHDGGGGVSVLEQASSGPSLINARDLAQVKRPGFMTSAPMARLLARVNGDPDPIESYIEEARRTEAGVKAYRLLKGLSTAVQNEPDSPINLSSARAVLEELAAKRQPNQSLVA